MSFDIALRDNGAGTFDLALSSGSSTTASAAEATGTGSANAGAPAVLVNAAGATGTGSASGPTAEVQPNSAEATGTGSANSTTSSVGTATAEATGTGTAEPALPALSPVGDSATGTGTAHDATVSSAGGTTAPAAEATGTGSAEAPTTLVTPTGGSTGSGAAQNATGGVKPAAGGSTGSGTAYDATVSTASNIFAAAAEAVGSGAAIAPLPAVLALALGATGTGEAFDRFPDASHVASVDAATVNTMANTNLSFTLPTAAVGDTTFVDISIQSAGVDIDPGFNIPSGWTQIGYSLDTTGGLNTAVYQTSIFRRKQSGDPGTLNITWTNAGQANLCASSYNYVDALVPVPIQSVNGKGATTSAYSVSLTTAAPAWIRRGFANRSGHTFSGVSGTVRGTRTLTSALSIVVADSGTTLASGGYTFTATGSGSTQIGSEWAYAILPGDDIAATVALPTVASGSGSAYQPTVIEDRIAGGATGNNSSPSVTLSSQIRVGQTVLVHIALNNSDNITSTPAVLTQIDSVGVGTSNAADHIYVMTADSLTPGSTLVWGLSATRNWTVTYLTFSNVDQQIEVTVNAVESVGDNVAATTSFTMPTLDSSADSYIVEVFAAKGDGVGITDLGVPGGYTPRAEVNNGATFGMSSAIADRTGNPSDPGTYGGETWTTNQPSVTTIRHIIALRVADTAQAAPAEGEAGDGYPLVTVNAGVAAGSGDAPFDPNGVTTSTTLIGDNPIFAVGAAFDAVVQTGIFVTATPTTASGSGSASAASPRVGATGNVASGTGSSDLGVFEVDFQAEAATGAGEALDAFASLSRPADAEVATGAGSAYDATISTDNMVTAPPSTTLGTGSAYDATVITYVDSPQTIALPTTAEGTGRAITVFGYDVGAMLRIVASDLPGVVVDHYSLSDPKRHRSRRVVHQNRERAARGRLVTEKGLLITPEGDVLAVDDARLEGDGTFIRNPSLFETVAGSPEADALLANGYALEVVT